MQPAQNIAPQVATYFSDRRLRPDLDTTLALTEPARSVLKPRQELRVEAREIVEAWLFAADYTLFQRATGLTEKQVNRKDFDDAQIAVSQHIANAAARSCHAFYRVRSRANGMPITYAAAAYALGLYATGQSRLRKPIRHPHAPELAAYLRAASATAAQHLMIKPGRH